MKPPASPASPLLCAHDPSPVTLSNPGGRSPFVLTVEHAGRAVPASLGGLGVDAAGMERHVAYDIGAAALGEALSALLDAPLLLQPYSRLVIDCNRPLAAPDLIPAVSDGTPVPANRGLSAAARRQRFEAIHQPFHRAVTQLLDRRAAGGLPTLLVSLHSFTPMLAVEGRPRPWRLGLLFNRDRRLADALMAAFARQFPDVARAFNEPYTVDDLSDYTVPVHGEARGLPHVLLEIRNDEIADGEGRARWARMLSAALAAAAEDFAAQPAVSPQPPSFPSPEP